ncbi:NSF attachment protein [Cynara cardunculus var. scolymus]|uniref:NSF attachment protein n=1 Tax=Cynara cardunculus var. scolymus TaxID=59895 RepID=A0A103YJ03_CYNCS|nr:NSF attachment protein [Cynara cardunculus var. scolymus]
MSDQIAKGDDFQRRAEKKLKGWGLFGSKHEDAAELYEKAGNFYKLGKSWDKAGAVYVKLAECYLKCVSHLEKALNLFMEIGRLSMSARYCKEIAELYEQEENLKQAMVYYDKAADLYQGEEVNTSANQCNLKIAQFAAQLEQYQKAIDIFENIARQSLNNNLLKYGVKGHLLNAGICQLCKGDVVAITNALDKYQDMDPTFSGSREYRLLADLAASIDEEDVVKFTDAIKEYDSMTKLC